MAKPAYVTIMLLNPVENAIHQFEQPARAKPPEEQLLTCASPIEPFDRPRNLVPKRRLSMCLWFVVNIALFQSWFSLTISIPKLQKFYGRNFMEMSMQFWLLPLILALSTPYYAKGSRNHDRNSLVFLIVTAFANALGCAIKCTATPPNGYYFAFIGQLIILAALSTSLGFPLSFVKQFRLSKWLLALFVVAVALGSIAGLMSLPLVLSVAESSDEIQSLIYKYFVWSAVFAIIPLVLIPFAVKEQKQYATADYDAFIAANVPSRECQPRLAVGQPCDTSSSIPSFFDLVLTTLKGKRCLLTVIANGMSQGLFLSMFIGACLCIEIEAKEIWILSMVESAVIVTCIFLIMSVIKLKLNWTRWLLLGNNVFLMALAFTVAFNVGAGSLPLRLLLFYLIHSSSGFSLFLSTKKVNQLPRTDPINLLFVTIFVQCLLATVVCVLLCFLLWKVKMVTWSFSVCLLCIISASTSALPL